VTEDLFSHDAYVASCTAIVTAVSAEGIVLDRTVFYPRGGGQPGDTGVLHWQGKEIRIFDTSKSRTGDDIVHSFDEPAPPVGATVSAEVDWDRRYRLMRTHTALHCLSGVVYTSYGARVTGGNMEPGVARMDFELDTISREFGLDVEAELNRRLGEGRSVRVSFVPRSEALADPDLIRTKVNLIPESVDPIRVVEIEEIDKQADGGTHVRSTLEVGAVRVVKTESKGRANKRMRIELEDQASS
jgi:misacylated tRNA(Ala) deacylase